MPAIPTRLKMIAARMVIEKIFCCGCVNEVSWENKIIETAVTTIEGKIKSIARFTLANLGPGWLISFISNPVALI
jgi:hypothetical protein